MGTIDRHAGRCRTCDCTYAGSGTKLNDCPGHFGHIELSRPVYHVGYLDQIVKLLRCVCFHCSRLLVDKSSHKTKRVLSIIDPETRMRHVHDLCRTKKRCETVEDGEENQMDGLMKEWVNTQRLLFIYFHFFLNYFCYSGCRWGSRCLLLCTRLRRIRPQIYSQRVGNSR